MEGAKFRGSRASGIRFFLTRSTSHLTPLTSVVSGSRRMVGGSPLTDAPVRARGGFVLTGIHANLRPYWRRRLNLSQCSETVKSTKSAEMLLATAKARAHSAPQLVSSLWVDVVVDRLWQGAGQVRSRCHLNLQQTQASTIPPPKRIWVLTHRYRNLVRNSATSKGMLSGHMQARTWTPRWSATNSPAQMHADL